MPLPPQLLDWGQSEARAGQCWLGLLVTLLPGHKKRFPPKSLQMADDERGAHSKGGLQEPAQSCLLERPSGFWKASGTCAEWLVEGWRAVPGSQWGCP